MRRRPCCGFTLIEVVIALFVIALGMGALLSTLVSSAENTGHLRDKSFAEWVALNRISTVRLGTGRPGTGVTTGDADYAGMKWRWRQAVSDPGMAGILRIDVSVAHADAPGASGTGASDADKFPALATAYGFIGTKAAAPNGFDPDWSLQAAATASTSGTSSTGTTTTSTSSQTNQ